MESLNRTATELVDEAMEFADELSVDVHTLSGDSVVLDFGVDVPGSIEGGLLLAEILTAGLSTVGTQIEEVAGAPLTHVELSTDHPALALLCSAKGGWELSGEEFEGLGSGPARALVAEEEIYERMGYRDEFEFAVLAVESETLPTEGIASHVAQRTGVPETGVFLPAFSTASVTGSVLAAARTAELAVFRLSETGYDPRDVLSVSGSAPVAPIAAGESVGMARTNDAVAYGGRAHLVVEEPFDRFDEVVSTAADEYGTPFESIFESVGWEYADLPVELFAPAQVTVDVLGAGTHVVGETSETILAESYGF